MTLFFSGEFDNAILNRNIILNITIGVFVAGFTILIVESKNGKLKRKIQINPNDMTQFRYR